MFIYPDMYLPLKIDQERSICQNIYFTGMLIVGACFVSTKLSHKVNMCDKE